ncbi:hypothetical protein PWT90_01665 [Aphanocladium album]|nr:hypothetical protein PWT90_01665 [Aphanocladium album]
MRLRASASRITARRLRRPIFSPSPAILARPALRSLVTLAIETSCDDTAVAVLEHNDADAAAAAASATPRTRLLFNERISSDLRAYRGIRPAKALEGHQRTLAGLVREGIARLPPRADDGRRVPDFVSVTRGPGIHANLSTGLFTAKGLAVAWGVPLVGVHHMQAHALTPRLVRALGMMPVAGEDAAAAKEKQSAVAGDPEFPFLTLLVSGGHSQLVLSASLTDHRVLATTTDVAVGNLLDQTARVILPEDVLDASPDVMYGRHLEAYAFDSSSSDPYSFYNPPRTRGDELADVDTGYPWRIPLPMRATRKLAYSFSAVHSTVHAIAAERAAAGGMDDAERRCLARHTQRVAFQHLVSRLCLALDENADYDGAALARQAKTLVVAGGVACNKFLMHVLRTTLEARGLLLAASEHDNSRGRGDGGIAEIVAPPVALCTDNAAMIAWAGMEMFRAGWHTDLDVLPVTKWPLDPGMRLPEKDGGGQGGLMEIGGWQRWK